MDMEFGTPGLEIDVAEGLKAVYLKLREFYEHTAFTAEAFEVGMALAIEIRVHFFDLEIGHVGDAPAEGAFVGTRASELESLNEASLRKHLAWAANHLGKAYIAGEDTDNVGAAGDPDMRFVFFGA
jgi:hypothetical protein